MGGAGDAALALLHLCRGGARAAGAVQPPAPQGRTGASTAATAIPRWRSPSFAGIPPTKTCMNCHSQIWTNAPMLEPVRESYRTGQTAGVDAGQRSAGLRVFRPQHSHQQGRGLQHLPRPGGQDAADVQPGFAADGVVPGLPSRAGEVPAAAPGAARTRRIRRRWATRSSTWRISSRRAAPGDGGACRRRHADLHRADGAEGLGDVPEAGEPPAHASATLPVATPVTAERGGGCAARTQQRI